MGVQSAERTIAIRRPVDQVYRFLADGRTASQWRSGELEIAGCDPDARVDFRSTAGRVRIEGTFALEPMGEATILTCALRGSLPGWRGLAFPGVARSAAAAELRALDELRDLLER